jgi:hypothetical protein
MKESIRTSVLLVATVLSSVAFISFLNASTHAGFSVSEVIAAFVALGVFAFFVSDYSRKPHHASATRAREETRPTTEPVRAKPRGELHDFPTRSCPRLSA